MFQRVCMVSYYYAPCVSGLRGGWRQWLDQFCLRVNGQALRCD